MAAKKNPLADDALKLYRSGMKLVDIAVKLGVPDGTVRRWKNAYGWDGERSGYKSERSDGNFKAKKNGTDEDINDTLRNDELTPKEQMFCILYSRTFNATQSYLKTHDCSYNTANTEGYKLLIKPCIKKEIERLKEIKRQQIVAGADDIVEIQMRIAFADMGSYVSFDRNGVFLQQSDQVDTQLVQEVKQGQHGISIKLADRQKAIDWLSKYFLLHPEDKYRAEYDRKRAEAGNAGTEQMLQNIQTIADILQCPSENRSLENFEGKEEVNDEQTGAAE